MSNNIVYSPTSKKRIEFIDLAKGVCILLVVISHCHINIPYLQYIRMPLYYILSGLFFKQYSGGGNFTLRKINKILIPFLFFYISSFGLYLLIQHFAPNIQINSVVEEFRFDDPFYSRLCINNPLWFLLSLFTVNLIYYVIYSISQNKWWHCIIVIIMAACAYLLKISDIELFIYLNMSLYYIPFFFVGYFLKGTNLLIENPKGQNRDIIFGLITLTLFVVTILLPFKEPLHTIRFYIAAILGVITLLLFLKKIKKIPFVSYCGRYSIIILCTSYWVYSPLTYICKKILAEYIDDWYKGVVFIITMVIEYFVIKFCIRYMPYVTAQKDLIPVKTI